VRWGRKEREPRARGVTRQRGKEKKKERMRPLRRVAMLAIVGSVLLVAFAGVAWAANITCTGGPCAGTEENDRITGSLLDDDIQALGGRDEVTARPGDDKVDGR
jgi:hypothetical protein